MSNAKDSAHFVCEVTGNAFSVLKREQVAFKLERKRHISYNRLINKLLSEHDGLTQKLSSLENENSRLRKMLSGRLSE